MPETGARSEQYLEAGQLAMRRSDHAEAEDARRRAVAQAEKRRADSEQLAAGLSKLGQLR